MRPDSRLDIFPGQAQAASAFVSSSEYDVDMKVVGVPVDNRSPFKFGGKVSFQEA